MRKPIDPRLITLAVFNISESMQQAMKAFREMNSHDLHMIIINQDMSVVDIETKAKAMPFHLKFHNPHAFELGNAEPLIMQDMVKYNKLKTQLHLATMRKDKHLIKQIEAQMRNCYA